MLSVFIAVCAMQVGAVPSAALPTAADATPGAPPPILQAPSSAAEPPPALDGADAFASPAAGLYPLWEQTGTTLPEGRVYLGTSAAEVGLPGGLQVGLSPTNLVMRVPNLHFKAALLQGPRLALALQLGAYLLLPSANEAFLSSRYTSGFDTGGRSVLALPLSLAARWSARRWLVLHGSTTVLGVTGHAPVETTFTPGAFLSVELAPKKNHGLFLHTGQLGLSARDSMQVFGASYRFHTESFEARLGYVYRHSRDGIQGQPLFSLGLQL
jgi:hypothetical protein